MKLVAIIPSYNESVRIADTVKKTFAHVNQVLVIDDGSTDETVKNAEEAGAIVIRHPHNLGKGAACRSGFYAAIKLNCDAIIMLDGDGQHDPEDIPRFVEIAKANLPNPCLVVGSRMDDSKGMPFVRLATNRILSFLISFLARQKISDSQCGFRLIHRDILEKVDCENNRYDAESEILVRASRAGFKIVEAPIRTIYGNEFSKINEFWDTLRFVRFFFRHLFYSPPISDSQARDISITMGESLVTESEKSQSS